MMGDDFATQTGLLVSPQKWKRFLKPGIRQYIDLAHARGLRVTHHTCGAVEPLIPTSIGTAHNLQADIPVENIVALPKAYHEFAHTRRGGRHDGA